MDEIKGENYMEIVTDGCSVLVETDKEDMQPTFSEQKSQSEVNLFMDEVVGVCASVCGVCVCVLLLLLVVVGFFFLFLIFFFFFYFFSCSYSSQVMYNIICISENSHGYFI
jgi:hypothetical protein